MLPEGLERLDHAFRLTDIRLNRTRFSTQFLNAFAKRFGLFVAVMIGDAYIAARVREFHRDGAADATRATGHKSSLACELFGHCLLVGSGTRWPLPVCAGLKALA